MSYNIPNIIATPLTPKITNCMSHVSVSLTPRHTMLDQCQKLHSTSHDSAEEKEFDFWGAYSPPSWETNTLSSINYEFESSPLLPHNHHYNNLSPTSRRQVILDSRRELMEMIENMPESCFELSLKDIVDDDQKHGTQEEVQEETEIGVEKKSLYFDTEAQKIRKQNKKSYKACQISRTTSMQCETFLIKMFFPTFLGSKKKAKAAGNRSKVSPSPSFQRPENHKDRWVVRFFLAGARRTSSSNKSTTRFSDSKALPGCLSFFHSKKSKCKRQRGCLL